MERPHILVVDDDVFNLHIIGEILEGLEFELQFAESGEQAWECLSDAAVRHELVILDRMMPGISGLEVLRRMKGDERLKSVPVIMQTAAAAPDQVREGLEAGAYYYLTKPFNPDALMAIVRSALEHWQRLRDVERQRDSDAEALALMEDGRFRFRTLRQARSLAHLAARLCPNGDAAVMGLTELLVNAVEHGNLGVTYAEKKRLREDNTWDEEIARRLDSPQYRERLAEIAVRREGGHLVFTIADQGAGFDWQGYLDFDPGRAFDPNGRGIALARQLSFSSVEYLGRGNVVRACIRLDAARAAAPGAREPLPEPADALA
ncbi:MAG: response regulator [Betaproteobacteria bacterium]|nr:response regulator [Betaproteobacteria bacterium]